MATGLTRRDYQRSLEAADVLARQLAQIEAEVGGRDGLLAALQLVPDPSATILRLVGLLADPQFATDSLLDICESQGLTAADLIKAYQRGCLARAHLRSLRIISEKLPPVVDDVMTRGAPYEAPCEACQGTGTHTADPTGATPNPEPQPCAVCGGAGKLTYAPDLERSKAALTLGGLIKAGTGIQIAVQQSQSQGQASMGESAALPSFAALQGAIDEITTGRRPTSVVEAEPADDADTNHPGGPET